MGIVSRETALVSVHSGRWMGTQRRAIEVARPRDAVPRSPRSKSVASTGEAPDAADTPLHARGIWTETPPAGASTEPLYGRGKDNHTRSVLRPAHRQSQPGMGGDATWRGGQRREKTAAQRLSATFHYTTTSRPIPSDEGILRLAAAFVALYCSHLPNPSKDRLTPSNTSTRYLFWP
jgi:hypothetical protein